MSVISQKICMVGDFGVGKTSLIRRYVDRQFSDRYLSTVGVKISRKTIELLQPESQDIIKLQLIIWDLEGHTRFKSISPTYLQGAKGALIVADVTRTETIERIPEHVKLFSSVSPKGSIVVAFNKIDSIDSNKIESKIEELKASINLKKIQSFDIYETSAKTGKNVDLSFENIAQKMLENRDVKSPKNN